MPAQRPHRILHRKEARLVRQAGSGERSRQVALERIDGCDAVRACEIGWSDRRRINRATSSAVARPPWRWNPRDMAASYRSSTRSQTARGFWTSGRVSRCSSVGCMQILQGCAASLQEGVDRHRLRHRYDLMRRVEQGHYAVLNDWVRRRRSESARARSHRSCALRPSRDRGEARAARRAAPHRPPAGCGSAARQGGGPACAGSA